MCLHSQSIKPVPPETVRVAKAAFPKGNPYLTLRDEFGTVFDDKDFAELFALVGQPALPPWRVALVTVLQFKETLSDRQAADAVRSRIDWKYLLGLDLTDQGFDFSVLSEFRQRLVKHKQEHLLLDKLLLRCKEQGLLKARSQQRTDATRVLASIRKLNRLELVGETMRAALNELATVAPEWLSASAPEAWYDRYGQRVEDYRLPKTAGRRDAYGLRVGQDAYHLLSCLEASTLENWQKLAQIKALKTTLERHYEYHPDAPEKQRVRWKSKKELPRAEAGIESPYDIDARYRSRRGVNWVGYAVHLSESCEDEACHLITHVDTTDAAIHEAQRTEVIHQSLADKHLLPSEHFVDAAYVSAEHLVSAEKRQIELFGPAHQNTSWQSRRKAGIDEAQFAIDWSTKTVTCPKGKHSVSWKHFGRDTDNRTRIRAMFDSQDCLTCEYKVLCTKGA